MSAEVTTRPRVPTLEERYHETLNKCDYLSLKIENYDRLINDAAEIKNNIDKFLEISEKALEVSKDSFRIEKQLSSDLQHLRDWLRSESERYDERYEKMKKRLEEQSVLIESHKKNHSDSVVSLHQKILEKFMSYPTLDEMLTNFERQSLELEYLKHEQDAALDKTNASHAQFERSVEDRFRESELELSKKLGILQNKFVRSLHDKETHDIQ